MNNEKSVNEKRVVVLACRTWTVVWVWAGVVGKRSLGNMVMYEG